MGRRIVFWMLIGLGVASCWAVIAALIPLTHNPGRSTAVWITAPASLIGRRMPLGMWWFILLNGGVYAVVGSAIEILRRSLHPSETGLSSPR